MKLVCPNGHSETFTIDQQDQTLLHTLPIIDAQGNVQQYGDYNIFTTHYTCNVCGIRFVHKDVPGERDVKAKQGDG